MSPPSYDPSPPLLAGMIRPTIATVGALLSLALSSVTAQDTKAASSPSKDDAQIRKLAASADVVLVRAAHVFVPGRDGKTPRIHKGEKAWLAYRGGRWLGLFAEPADGLGDDPKAKVLDFTKDHPESFAMPGLVDADSRWFKSSADISDSRAAANARSRDSLELWQKGWKELPRRGVTTVFVPASTSASLSGQGALVGLDPETGAKGLRDGALLSRVSSLQSRGNNLTRKAVTRSLESSFEAAKKYKEAKDKWKKSLEEYKKKRKEFLAFYKKNPLKPGQKAPSSTPTRRSSLGRRRGVPRTKAELEKMLERFPPAVRDRMRQRLEAMMKAQADAAKKAGAAKKPTTAKPDAKKSSKKAPPRPKYPKPPKKDPVKEELLRILDGKRTLRIEVHRHREIEAVLALAKKLEIADITLVGATEAWKVAKAIRSAGARVVLSPQNPPSSFDTLPEHHAANAAKLASAGVPVAFGSAGKESGAFLSLIAARAVAHGMSEAQALQALTQNSLEACGSTKTDLGVVVFSNHALASDARAICITRGREVRMLGGKQ